MKLVLKGPVCNWTSLLGPFGKFAYIICQCYLHMLVQWEVKRKQYSHVKLIKFNHDLITMMECSAATWNQNKFILITYISIYKNNICHPSHRISGTCSFHSKVHLVLTAWIKRSLFFHLFFFETMTQIFDLQKKKHCIISYLAEVQLNQI